MKSIWNCFMNSAKKEPNKIAIICDENSISYIQLLETCMLYSEYFRSKGIRKGMHVGLWIEKSIEFTVALFALLRIGAVVAPLNTSYKPKTIDMFINAANLEKVIYSTRMSSSSSLLSKESKERLVIFTNKAIDSIEKQGEETPFEECLFLMTSGSTGQPKIAVISQKAMLYRLEIETLHFSLDRNDRVLISTPIYHSLGIRFLMTALTDGITVVLPKAFKAEQWLKLINEEQITYTITVPSQISEVLKVAKDQPSVRNMLHSLKYILSTSAYLPPNIKKAFLPLISGKFLNFIASSETEFIAWTDCKWDDPEDNMLGEVFPTVDIKILQNETIVENGMVGEIITKSKQLFSYYYGNAALTNASFWNGYYRTGDLGFFDEKGKLHYAGRIKNTIICSGVNVFPKDIEQVILQLPKVEECVAFGLPNPKCGEIIAVVVKGNNINREMILRQCLESLAPYQQPRKIFIVKCIPRNELGKIDLVKLKRNLADIE